MRCNRRWGMVLIAISFVVAAAGLAQSKITVEEIDEAILTMKNIAKPRIARTKIFRTKFQRARSRLIRNQKDAFAKVEKLLDEKAPQTRLIAAIILAEYTKQKEPSPELGEALKRCVGDTNDGVRLWGMRGTLRLDATSVAQKKAAVAECLKPSRPSVLRIDAAWTAERTKYKEAAPLLLAHLESILPDYEKAVAEALTVRRTLSGGERDGDRNVRFPPELAEQNQWPDQEPNRDDELEPEEIKIDPSKIGVLQAKNLIEDMQGLSVCFEVQNIGYALEKLVLTSRDKPFGFRDAPPWDLKKCIKAAKTHLEGPAKPDKAAPKEPKKDNVKDAGELKAGEPATP